VSRPSTSDPAAAERGLAELARKDPRRAAARARALAAREGDPLARARLLRAEGSALQVLGRHREALRSYDRARALFARHGTRRDLAQVDLGRADGLAQSGRGREALRAAAAARRGFLAGGEPVPAAMADANAGLVAWRLDRPAEARDLYLRARRAFRRAGHRHGVAVCDLNLANALASLDDRRGARVAYAAARSAFLALDMGFFAAQADYNEAWLRATEDRPGEALALLASAEAAFRRLGDERHLALVDLDRGEIHLRCGLLPEAEEALARAAGAFRRLGVPAERARALGLLGGARGLAGNPAGAREPLDAAAAIHRRLGNRGGLALVDLYRAHALRAAGRDPSVPAGRAAAAFRRLGMRTREAAALLVPPGARGARAALARLGRIRAPGLAFAAHRALAADAAARGRRAEAARHFEQALRAAEGLREGLTADEMRLAFLRDREGFFEECARFLLAGGGPRAPLRALAVMERARGRALLDLALLGVSTGGPAEERLRESLRFASNLRAGAGGERLRGAVDEGEVARIEARLDRAVSAGTAAPPDAEDIPDLVPADTAAATFLLEEDEGVALLVRGGEVTLVPGLPGRDWARKLSAALLHEVERAFLGGGFGDRHAERLLEDAGEVIAEARRAFLEPILAVAPERRLVVVPSGPLHGFPFPALAPERVVSVVPSLAFLHGRSPASADAPLLFGIAGSGADRAEEEVRSVAARLPGARVRAGAAATRASFFGEGPGARLLHFATHGVFRADNPMASALRLDDGWLAAHEVLGMRLKARLAVLSACETGRARIAPGEEILGLARGFLGAGVRALVVSLWRVPDAATARMMERLYDGLASGLAVDEALREAQSAARERGDHPASWAAFVPLGPAVRIAPTKEMP